MSIHSLGIKMFSNDVLKKNKGVNKLLDVLEENKKFKPMLWGNYEWVKLPYCKTEIAEKFISGDIDFSDISLYRKKAIKYEVSFRETCRLGTRFGMRIDKAIAKKDWSLVFDLSDKLAQIIKPRFGTAHIYHNSVRPWENEYQRLIEYIDTVAQGRAFRNVGPGGLGMRTYFSGDILELFGLEFLKNIPKPAVVTELSWGGIRIDLIEKPWEKDIEEILDIWVKVMDYLESAKVFAIPTFPEEKRHVRLKVNEKWKNRKEILGKTETKNNNKEVVMKKEREITQKDKIIAQLSETKETGKMLDKLDINKMDLSFADLPEIMAERLKAEEVNLKGAFLVDSVFRDCWFADANFESANLAQVDIADCVMSGGNFKNVNLRYAKMAISSAMKCCFDGADFTHGDISSTDMSESTFRETNLTKIDGEDVDFSNCDLTSANLTDGNFEDANFTNAKLEGVKWRGANIENAIFDEGVKEQILKMI